MSKAFSLKSENKPMLFSYDLETEYQKIERWVNDNKRYSKRNLESESIQLRIIAKDYLDIIENENLTELHLENLISVIKISESGIWESATNKLELLCYHFEKAKQKIIEILNQSDTKTTERLLNCLSESFTTEEQIKILKLTFNNKSKKIKLKSANIALELRNLHLVDYLKTEYANQIDVKVKEEIQFAIENMWQPKGELTF